ncbi:hypothetical protein SAMN04515647_2959 [Cohaesibacter sp. ES.047]|uniref:hypothetical protein n=1 Tax=Cohaesibacter sp. ES.047 TaxID=1798205 RepID=UPI000BC0B114|nr:hypothetical protein [Cohaesibacter sp. ES.047]SNY92690.1 hypothetical protein SAMN04515647_2959 [Cohaesibacter sp. ES.047]
MFDSIKGAVGTIGMVFASLPPAARIAGDIERGRTPNEADLQSLGIPTDIQF